MRCVLRVIAEMPPKTVTSALINMLEDLTEMQLMNFRSAILDRREEPRVRRVCLEGKTRLEIADVLVSTYTESGVIDVVLETLREIGCNAQRERFGEFNMESDGFTVFWFNAHRGHVPCIFFVKVVFVAHFINCSKLQYCNGRPDAVVLPVLHGSAKDHGTRLL